jgi:ABC-type lipoprotein release transport system permease subunit
VTPDYLVAILLVAVLGAVAAALWPSARASRLRPVEALGAV